MQDVRTAYARPLWIGLGLLVAAVLLGVGVALGMGEHPFPIDEAWQEWISSVRGRRLAVHATPVRDDEREAVWRVLEAQWPDYREYERDSGRTARIFRLQPTRELGRVDR